MCYYYYYVSLLLLLLVVVVVVVVVVVIVVLSYIITCLHPAEQQPGRLCRGDINHNNGHHNINA